MRVTLDEIYNEIYRQIESQSNKVVEGEGLYL